MRVLHLNTHSSGGSYEYAALLCSGLAEQGIESHVLCKNQSAQTSRPFFDRVIRRSYVSLSTEPWHGTRRLLAPPPREELQRIDVVHLHTVADWFDVPSWVDSLPTDISIVVSLHDMWHMTGGCFLYRGCNLYTNTCTPCPILKTALNRVLAKDEHKRKLKAYRNRRAHFVANSQWLADLAERSPVVRACGGARVITPGIDTAIFRTQEKAQCRAELAIPPGAFVIAGGAASLTDQNKNIAWLLERLSRLSRLESVLILLAGDGNVPVPGHLNVRFMGNLTNCRERAKFFGAADVFVSASLMETYGLTLIEAMSCGTPVVAFRAGGIPEAVPDGEAGILCELLDRTAFENAIQKIRSCEPLRHQLGNAASNVVASRNSKAQFAGAFARLYRECVNAARTPATGEGSGNAPFRNDDEQKETKITGLCVQRRAEICDAENQL